MVLDKDKDAMFPGCLGQLLVVLEELDGGLGDQDVNLALDGIQRNGVVGGIGGENGDGVTGRESVNGSLVSVGIALVVGRE